MLRNKVTSILNICSKAPNRLLHVSPLRLDDVKIEKSINQITLLGRVGQDPQMRGTEAHPVVTFSLATHNNYKYESGEMLQRTDWHRISVFRPYLRDTIYKFLKKGQRIYVAGRLTYGEIKTEEGQTKYTSTVVADDVIFLQNNTAVSKSD